MHIYRIHLQGHLDGAWADWLGPLTLRHRPDGTTELLGPLPDQAALYGLLAKLRDLGIPLLNVDRVDNVDAETL